MTMLRSIIAPRRRPRGMSVARAIVAAATAALTACGPSDLVGKDKIGKLDVGMPRDAVLAILGTGTLTPNQPGDALRLSKGFRQQ